MKRDTGLVQGGSQLVGKGGCAMYLNFSVSDDGMLVLSLKSAIKKTGLTNDEVTVLRHNSDIVAHMLELFMKDRGMISDGGIIDKKPTLEVFENPIAFADSIINKLRHCSLDWDHVRALLCTKLSGARFRTLESEELEKLNHD